MTFPRVVCADAPVDDAVGLIVDALKGLPTLRVAVSGGSAAALVGALRRTLGKRWSQVRLTWADERAVPFEDADSNRGGMYRSGALELAHPPRQELALFEDGESLISAATRASTIFGEDFGGLDVAILGLGGDGHVASHFPNVRAEGDGAVQIVTASPKPPENRLTLSLSVLASSGLNVIYACGEGKRAALQELLGDGPSTPASGLDNLVIVTDLDGLPR